MKKFLFLFLILSSCTTSVHKATSVEDTIRLQKVRELFIILKTLDSTKVLDSSLVEENQRLKDRISATIDYTLNYHENEIKIGYLDSKIEEIKIEKKQLETKYIELRKKNDSLIRQNEGYKYKLADEYEKRTNILKDKAKIEKDLSEAGKLIPVGLNIKGIGETTSLFGKIKIVETTSATKIKRVLVSFIIPTNKFANKEKKDISIYLYSENKKGFIKKDTTVSYIGDEIFISQRIKGEDIFREGPHLINIYINSKLEIEKNFIITK